MGIRDRLKVRILTGRTPQIRVHLAHLRHPIIGDPVYGVQNIPQVLQNYGLREARLQDILKPVSRQMLHAIRLSFCHTATKEWLSFYAPPPQDMQMHLADLEDYLNTLDPDNQPVDFTEI